MRRRRNWALSVQASKSQRNRRRVESSLESQGEGSEQAYRPGRFEDNWPPSSPGWRRGVLPYRIQRQPFPASNWQQKKSQSSRSREISPCAGETGCESSASPTEPHRLHPYTTRHWLCWARLSFEAGKREDAAFASKDS